MRFWILLMVILGTITAKQNCAWFIGKLECSKPERLEHTVVEIWDADIGFFPFNILDEDDLAGRTILTSDDDGNFRVEGCASDMNFLFINNEPDFYLKIRHSCRGRQEVTEFHPKDSYRFVPETNDFLETPLKLG